MSAGRVDVLYIGGTSRSGSTLLLRLLNTIQGYHSVGELWIIDNAFRKNPLCGCGALFNQCEFWVPVIERAFGGFDHVDLDRLVRLKEFILQRNRVLPLIVPALRDAEYNAQLGEYRDFLSRLYQAMGEVSGQKVIIDSSKSAAFALVLSEIPSINLNVVHLVRDSRAVAYSWQRKKPRPEYYWGNEYMEQFGPIRCALGYFRPNALLPLVASRGGTYTRIRYEDLARDPGGQLRQIVRLMGDDVDGIDRATHGNTFALGVDHTVAGNPMRFQRGLLEVRPDEEWRTGLSRRDKYLVTALTWPFLLAYGYWGRRS